jgi:hypothetical protein
MEADGTLDPMATLSFDGETHDEIVRKVRRWLASLDGPEATLTPVEVVDKASELTKDALTVIAQAAPGPVARSEVIKALTRMGYDATESTRRSVIGALDALADAEDGVVQRAEGARRSVVYEMNAAVAKQLLRSLRR